MEQKNKTSLLFREANKAERDEEQNQNSRGFVYKHRFHNLQDIKKYWNR